MITLILIDILIDTLTTKDETPLAYRCVVYHTFLVCSL